MVKNQKKMKNTMYIVFGVFALTLFGITMLNPSYAEEWLIIDDALDAIMQWREMYGSWGFEKVEEEKMIQPVEDHEDEDIVEPEVTSDEEIEEWEGEDFQDLESKDNENTDVEILYNSKKGDDKSQDLNNIKKLNNEEWKNMKFGDLLIDTFEAWQEVSTIDGCYTWRILENDKIEISAYNIECWKDVEIPNIIQWFNVTKIWDWVFNNMWLNTVRLPNNLIEIWSWAFANNNFSIGFKIEFPETLKYIHYEAFMNSSLRHIELPENLEYIWEYSFQRTTPNTRNDFDLELKIPDSVKILWQYAFQCTAIKKLEFWTWLEVIWDYAFQSECYNTRHMSSFDTVVIPDNVKKIWYWVFQSNRKLNNVIVWSWNWNIEIKQSAFDSCWINNFIIDKKYIIWEWISMWNNPYENIVISGDFQYLWNWLLFDRSNNNGRYTKQWNISLTLNLTWKLSELIWSYSNIKEIILWPNLTEINTVIYRNFWWNHIIIPWNIKKVYDDKTDWHYNMYQNEIILEEWLEEIWDYAFKDSYNVRSLTIPKTVKLIWEDSFRYNKNLSVLKLQEWIEKIWTWAFKDTNMDVVYVPDSVKFIWKNAFVRVSTWDSWTIKQKMTVYVINDIIPEIEDPETVEYIRRYKIDFTWNSNLITHPERQIVDLNEIAADPNTPEIEWYTFWWYKQWENVPYDFSIPITENIVLEARLTKNNYKVTYKDNNGALIEEKMVEFESKIPTQTPTKQWYIFKWWAWLTENGIMPAHDIVLTANWEEEPNRFSWWGWKNSVPAASEMNKLSEITAEVAIENEHNSATDNEKGESDADKTSLNEETSKEVISVTQEIAEDWTEVEVVVETVKIKNTDIVATVRTEVSSASSSSSSSSSTIHTKEQNDAYNFAKSNWITTTLSIEDAKMNTELTRIQMAKMLSNFAINVLWEEPAAEKWIVKFDDVTNKLDKQYDNAVTKSYQLWIMWQNVKNNEFRPNDEVTRAEFASALSRLLYQTEEWEYKWTSKYYIPHITKLYNEWIINKADPKIKEKRWYVMTMLKRVVE